MDLVCTCEVLLLSTYTGRYARAVGGRYSYSWHRNPECRFGRNNEIRGSPGRRSDILRGKISEIGLHEIHHHTKICHKWCLQDEDRGIHKFQTPSAFSVFVNRLDNPTRKFSAGWNNVLNNDIPLNRFRDQLGDPQEETLNGRLTSEFFGPRPGSEYRSFSVEALARNAEVMVLCRWCCQETK